MTAISSQHIHPVQLLFDLSQQAKESARGLPQRIDIKDVWSGIGFIIEDIRLIAPIDDVNEILHCPNLTMVPGTQPWVKGIANVRGTLMPIMDLKGFLNMPMKSVTNQSRVLVVRDGDNAVGLLVDEVLGLRHFKDEDKVGSVSRFEEALRPYVRGAFRRQNEEMMVVSLKTIASHPDFYLVTA